MTPNSACDVCGTPLTAGFCPRCLLDAGLSHEPNELPTQAEMPVSSPRLGDYELLEEIGRGGMGVVYRARQVGLDRIVAVKLLPFGGLGGKQSALRLRAEAVAAGSLRHPNIVAIHDVGLQDEQHFIAMDYVAGPSLAHVLRDGPLPGRRAASLMRQVALAVQHAHDRGIIHRDLKPSNILLDGFDDQPRITDFGLAKNLRSDTQLTLTGQTLGSPNYIPPEQIRGSVRKEALGAHSETTDPAESELGSEAVGAGLKKVSFASDVYALGATLYHTLTGRPPFIGQNIAAILHQVLNDEPLPPARLNPSIPADLETICLKCLEKEPGQRYATARQLAKELERFLNDEPIEARPIGVPGKAWRWCRRKPAIAALLLALNLALVLGVSGIIWQWRRAVASEASTRQHQYVSDMNLVQQVWAEGNVKRAWPLLRAYIPRPGEPDLRGFEWRYLWKLCGQDQSRYAQTNFQEEVRDLAYSPDRKFVAVAAGHQIKLLEGAFHRELAEITDPDPADSILRVVWSPENPKAVFTVGTRGQVKLWDLDTRQVSGFAQDSSDIFRTEIGALSFSPDGKTIALGSSSGGSALALWDVDANKLLWTTNLGIPPSTAVFTADGKELITGGGEAGNIRVWDPNTGQERARFPASHTGWVRHIALSPDGRTMASCGNDNHLILWDYLARQPRIPVLEGQFESLAFSPDGRLLASGGFDGLVRLFDTASGRQVALLRGHTGRVTGLTFIPDGKRLVSGSSDRTVRVWDSTAVVDKNVLQREKTAVNTLSFSCDDQLLAIGGYHQGWTEVWNIASRQWATNLMGHPHTALTAAFSPDGKYLAAGSYDNTVVLWNARTLERVAVLTNDFGAGCLAFHPNGHILAISRLSINPPDGLRTLAFWDLTSKQRLERRGIDGRNAGMVAFSRDGRLLAVGYVDGWVRLWDFATERKVGEFHGSGRTTCPMDFSPDGTLLACDSWENIVLYDVSNRRVLQTSEAHTGGVLCLAFAPDGKTLASAGNDGTIKFWNIATFEIALTLKPQESGLYPVYGLAFSHDGNLLATGGLGDARLWPAASFDEVKESGLAR